MLKSWIRQNLIPADGNQLWNSKLKASGSQLQTLATRKLLDVAMGFDMSGEMNVILQISHPLYMFHPTPPSLTTPSIPPLADSHTGIISICVYIFVCSAFFPLPTVFNTFFTSCNGASLLIIFRCTHHYNNILHSTLQIRSLWPVVVFVFHAAQNNNMVAKIMHASIYGDLWCEVGGHEAFQDQRVQRWRSLAWG